MFSDDILSISMKSKRVSWHSVSWQTVITYAALIAGLVSVLWILLGTLLPGLSAPEVFARFQASSWHRILANPLYLPHKLLTYSLILLGQTGAFWLRSVSALFGAVFAIMFFQITKTWYSQRIAIMATSLFVVSAWFLHFARLGTPDVLYLVSIGIVWIGVSLHRHQHRINFCRLLMYSFILVTALYTPGYIYLLIPLIIWQRKQLAAGFATIPIYVRILAVLGDLLAAAPLIYSFALHPSLIRQWLLIPAAFAPKDWFWNAVNIPIWLAWRGPTNPVYWLSKVRLLDMLTLTMVFLGLYTYWHYRALDRSRAVIGIIIVAIIISVFNGWLTLAIALPAIMLLAASGLALLLQQWFTIFPKNPLARGAGILLVATLVCLAVLYNVRAYFIAWPRNPVTVQAFRIRS